MSRFAGIGSSLQSVQQGIQNTSGDITAANVDGYKGGDTDFAAQVITQGGRTVVSGVSMHVKKRIDLQGAVAASNVATNVAVSGSGFIPVAQTADSSEILLTRRGDFAIDQKGNLVNSLGYVAMGQKLDDAGKMIGASDSLAAINVRGLGGRAKATENVSFDMRLDSGADVIKGSGQVMVFSSDDTFNASISDGDVIIPNGDNINLGDQITIAVGTDTRIYEFGGVASSFCMKSQAIFGKTKEGDKFDFQAADGVDATKATEGHKLTVRVGDAGETIPLKFVSSNPNVSNREFNSLSTLKDALNRVPGLTARISNSTLYVAPTDGTKSVTFNDGDATTFKALLGLQDIAGTTITQPTDHRRFATLAELKKVLIADGFVNAKKTTLGNGIDISAKDPLQNVTFTAKAERANAIKYVSVTGKVDAGAATVTIMAANNGLKAGDYVRLTGLNTQNLGFAGGNATANGIYYVTNANESGFTVSTTRVIDVGAGAAQVAADQTKIFPAAAGTWQKTTGQDIAAAVNFGGGQVSRNGANVVTINQVAHALVTNDVIYISGAGLLGGALTIPSGYYKVTRTDNDNFTIGGAATLVAGGAEGPFASRGTFTKIGTQAGGAGVANSIETTHTFIASPTLGAPLTRVRVYMPDHGYSRDDYVRIGGAAIHAEVDGKTFAIKQVGANWFEFDTATAAGVAALVALGGAGVGSLPAANFIDRFGKLDKDLKLRQDKDGVALDAAYKPGDADFGLVSGNIDGTWVQSTTLYDSQGNPHDFKIAFAKVANNRWAVEIYTKADEDGLFDVLTDAANGIVRTGYINFDGDGKVSSIEGGIEGAIDIRWTNGADPSSVVFNWGDPRAANITALTSGGVRQTRGQNSVSFIDQDGYKPGKFVGLSVDGDTGDFVANFDNGEQIAIFRLPIAYVPAPNELEMHSDGIFKVSMRSGGVLYKNSGDEGVGVFEASATEGSNVDTTASTITLTEHANHYKYVSSALFAIRKLQEDFLRNI